MTVAGFDSYGPVPASALAKFGFVIRYVSLYAPKCVVPSEVKTYHNANKSLALVYEDGAQDALGGANAGAAKAHIAAPILKSIGWPSNLPVYFAVDFSPVSDQLATILKCVQTFAADIGRPEAVYGDVNTCNYARNNGVKFTWQFGEGVATGRNIYQGYPPITVDGIEVDPDTAETADYGQWAPPIKPPTPNGDDVTLHDIEVTIKGKEGVEPTTIPFAKAVSATILAGAGPTVITEVSLANAAGKAVVVVKGGPNGAVVTVRVAEAA